MKKVTNITLGGIVFAVEEDAYEKLASYLSGIEDTFKNNDDYSEIASDIESAIAEKFVQAKKNNKHAVTLADVIKIMEEMGQAKELAEASGETSNNTEEKKEETEEKETPHRLYRNTDDAILGGVCSGIASYFDVDPVIVRIAFVVAAFLNGLGVLIYILLWLIVPPAVTPTQKYAMRGESMTISHISERVKKKLNDLEAPKLSASNNLWSVVRNVIEKTFRIFGKIIKVGLHVIRNLIGFAFVLIGSLGIAALASGISIVWLTDYTFAVPELDMIIDTVLAAVAGQVFMAALIFAVSILCIITVMVGGSILASRNLFSLTKSLILFVAFITAVGIMGSIAALYAPAFIQEVEEIEQQLQSEQASVVLPLG